MQPKRLCSLKLRSFFSTFPQSVQFCKREAEPCVNFMCVCRLYAFTNVLLHDEHGKRVSWDRRRSMWSLMWSSRILRLVKAAQHKSHVKRECAETLTYKTTIRLCSVNFVVD